MDMKSAGILGGCIVVAALILSLVPRTGTAPASLVPQNGAAPAKGIHSAEGNLEVAYMVQTSPSTAEGSTMSGVTDIEFYPRYVVVKSKQGGGKVFYNERTQSLNWSLTSPTSTSSAAPAPLSTKSTAPAISPSPTNK